MSDKKKPSHSAIPLETATPSSGEFLLYQTEDAQTRIQVRLADGTLWLTQQQMAELFQTTQQNISLHIQNIYADGELEDGATHKECLWVRQEGNRQAQRELDSFIWTW